MAKKDDDDFRTRLAKLEFRSAVNHAVWLRCCAFWSGIIVFFGACGSWASSNIIPLKAAWAAFWNAWGQK